MGESSAASPPSDRISPPPQQPGPGRVPAWHLPDRLTWMAAPVVWGTTGSRFLYFALLALIVAAVLTQVFADATGVYLIDAGRLGIGAEPWRTIGRLVAVIAVAYLLLGLLAGHALRLWARQFGFGRIPELLGDMDAEVSAFAVSDVARCAPRREGARVARAAADTLEKGIALGAETALKFGRAVDPGPPTFDEKDDPLPPYRVPIAAPGYTAVTDAAGIYRLYPHYVAALRRTFASSLVDAIHNQWPRVRGEFWTDTSDVISRSASASLQQRLEHIRDRGIWQGDLANELANEMWSDPVIRAAAVAALDFTPDDPIAVLATPADQRFLDITAQAPIVLAIPPQLESLLTDRITSSGASVVISDRLETATVLRVFAFKPGLYTFASVIGPAGQAEGTDFDPFAREEATGAV